jgi:hypothetical protein
VFFRIPDDGQSPKTREFNTRGLNCNDISKPQLKKRRMSWVEHMESKEGIRNECKISIGKPEEKVEGRQCENGPHTNRAGVFGRDSFGPEVGLCGNGNEPSVSINCREFLDQLSYDSALKKDFQRRRIFTHIGLYILPRRLARGTGNAT